VGRQFGSARLPIAARLQVPVVEGDDRGAGQVNSLVERVAGASVLEIEKLVSELQGLRDLLRRETDRVQREMTGYVHLSDAAMKSSTIIADSVSQWKSAADTEVASGRWLELAEQPPVLATISDQAARSTV
jgi:hypothetical protein